MAGTAHWDTITYYYEIEGRVVTVTRHHAGTAYARNGNVGNPTQYYTWSAAVDGERVTFAEPSRAAAYELARAVVLDIDYSNPERGAGVNVRPFYSVAAEMKENYRRKVREPQAPSREAL